VDPGHQQEKEGEREGARGLGQLGRAEGGQSKLVSWAVQEERKEMRKVGWAGPRGRKRKEEKEGGPGQEEKNRERKKCIQIHLNLNLKFKFK
jgi:hypothetical protein